MTPVPAGSLPTGSRFRAPTGDDLRLMEHTITEHRPGWPGIPGSVRTTTDDGQRWGCLSLMLVEPLEDQP